MDDTKALSPDVIELFEKIILQAEEFSLVVSSLKESRDSIKRQKQDIEQLAEQFAKDIDLNFLKLENKVRGSIDNIEQRSEKTFEIYSELDDIRGLRDHLISLKDSLKRQSLEIESYLNSEVKKSISDFESVIQGFKHKANRELDAEISNIKSRVEKDILAETHKFEQRFNHKLAGIEKEFRKLESTIVIISDALQLDQKKYTRENDSIRNMLGDINATIENRSNDLDQKINMNNKTLTKEIKILKDMHDGIENRQSALQENLRSIFLSDHKDDDFEINKLTKEISEMKELLSKEKRKNLALYYVSAAALIISVFLLIQSVL